MLHFFCFPSSNNKEIKLFFTLIFRYWQHLVKVKDHGLCLIQEKVKTALKCEAQHLY